jgi:hypothetical protein
MTRLSLLILFLALLCGCAAPASPTPSATPTFTPTLTPSPTVTETPTATEIPKPLGSENLPQNVSLALNEDNSWGIKIGNEAKSIPGAVFDSTGLHMTLDSGRVVDIAASELQKGIVYDQEFNLLKIYDDQGIISAEYDPGAGQPNTPDYIPGQGWVDMQDLANKACNDTSTCFNENVRGLPSGTISVQFASTVVFRKINALNTQTNEPMGEFLLLQFVTRNTTDKPVIGWMIVQFSIPSNPGVIYSTVSEVIQSMNGVPLNRTDKSLQPIEQWQSWMPKSSKWAFGFLPNEGVGSFWSSSQLLGSADYQKKKTRFLTSHGDIVPDGIYPFFSNSSSPR